MILKPSFVLLALSFTALQATAQNKLPAKKVPSQTTSVETVTTTDNSTTAPEYKFNSSGTPAKEDSRGALQFKTGDEAKDATMANPVENIKNDQPYVTYVGYPRHQVRASANPTSTGFKQNYNGLPLNFSSTSAAGFDLNYRAVITPEFFFELNYNHTEFSVKPKALTNYTIVESTAKLDNVFASVFACKVKDHASHKLCYGATLGLDSFASLDFRTQTAIEITGIKDTVLGLNLDYSYPMMHSVNFLLNAAVFQGLKIGQSSNLGVKSNNRYGLSTGFEFVRDNLDTVVALASFDIRSAKTEALVGNNQDSWTTNQSSAALLLGYQWTFQTK